MLINEYHFLKNQRIIISRTSDQSYGILIGGNYVTVSGNSENQCKARLFTWIACVVCKKNNLSINQALYLHNLYSDWFGVQSSYYETIRWLRWMLDWEEEIVCFTQPLFLFDGLEYWQIIFNDLKPDQYVTHKPTQSVIVCITWKKYLIFCNNNIEEYAVEKDEETEQYYLLDGAQNLLGEDQDADGNTVLNLDTELTYEPIELLPEQKISEYLKEIVVSRVQQVTAYVWHKQLMGSDSDGKGRTVVL